MRLDPKKNSRRFINVCLLDRTCWDYSKVIDAVYDGKTTQNQKM